MGMEEKPPQVKNLSPLKSALLALESMELRLAESERRHNEPIAIIGMACRFPLAQDTRALWRLLADGTDAVREFPRARWNIDDYYNPDPDAPGKISTRWAGTIDDIDRFDAEFFGISPREAVAMDPQQRLLLEVSWEAIEDAGQNPGRLAESATGVFIGITGDEYAQLFYQSGDAAVFNAYFASGIARSVAAGRIPYTLGTQGPNLSIDTACSSSLVAVHTACLHLRNQECRVALAGGSNVALSPELAIAFSKAHMMAADGRCKTFDARADGFVRGEGCGVVVLKRLSDAVGDGDRVLAVIRGSAVNQDGRSGGLTVPNGKAQEAVIRQALARGGVRPEEVSYVEAHGTGTSLGDPIEAHALAAALGGGRGADQPLVVGSVKTNVGHLESAAGVAGLIKVVLSLQREEIPKNLHFETLNPHIDWGGVPVEIPVKAREWKRGERKRIAGVSSFGFSGTNAHVILEEGPKPEARTPKHERAVHLLALSARTKEALEQLVGRYGEELQGSEAELGDICFTANAGRAHFEHRVAVVGATAEEVREKLEKSGPGTEVRERNGVRPVFLFSGQGSQYAGMGKELYEAQPVFREAIDRCAEVLRGEGLREPLQEVLWGRASERLEQTEYTQPALFAVEWALAELWRSWGIQPGVVLGHSVGEYVAACVAGAYGVEEGLRLIAARGRLMQEVKGRGAMAAVEAEPGMVREALAGLEEQVTIGAVNGPASVVISGYEEGIAKAEERLKARRVRVKRLAVSHGFHSPQMKEMEEAFEEIAGEMSYGVPRVKLVSSVTGKELGRGEIGGGYWRRQVREAVQFSGAMETVQGLGHTVFLEIGPGTTLLGLGRQGLQGEGAANQLWLASLRKGRGDWEQVLESLGRLYERGADVDWEGFDRPYGRRRVSLPSYPFQRQRYWIEPNRTPKAASPAGRDGGHPLLGQRFEVAGNAGTSVWENEINVSSLPYLADHRAFEILIFPLTGYLEMMTAALRANRKDSFQLRDIALYEPLIVPRDAAFKIQVVLSGENIEIYSRAGDSWKIHASAHFIAPEASASSENLSALKGRIDRPIPAQEFYANVLERGMEFGPAFRCVRQIWNGEGESLAYVAGHETESGAYRIHPALFDGCLQAVAAALPDQDRLLYLPVSMECFRPFRAGGSRLWSHARIRPATSGRNDSAFFDIVLLDEQGPVAEVLGLEMRSTTSEVLQRHLLRHRDNPLFELSWEAKKAAQPSGPLTGDWLILADRSGNGEWLAGELQKAGARYTLLADSESVGALEQKTWEGVVQCRALDAPPAESTTVDALAAVQERICGSTLALLSYLAQTGSEIPRGLWLVTSGAQQVALDQRSLSPVQSTLWGMAQAISEEYPQFHCACVDLDPDALRDSIASLVVELSVTEQEEQVAFRERERYVARIVVKPMEKGLDIPQRLTISSRGLLDNLAVEPAHRRPVPAGCVEIQVDAAGLNFRDVLSALGMYPGDRGGLGSECAGHVVAVGHGVTGWRESDDVVAMAFGAGHEGFVIVDEKLVARKPANLSLEKAATLPTAFLTARYGLENLAHIRPGDRVLIHAATGGVGLAAVQIAQRAKAEIFATAGSERKRSFLRSLGVAHVMNSRTVDFAPEILRLTEGRGVDIVLNSLAGEAIAASFSVMAPRGRFIEIGKKGIWTAEQVENLGRNIDYHVLDLSVVAVEAPAIVGDLLRDTVVAVERGDLQALPSEIFSFRDAANAYRHMAQAQHIGKIVLRQSTCGARISPNATYLITGGFGGLGQLVARHLVERGARNLVLIGRNVPNSYASPFVEWATGRGALIVERRADVSDQADMAEIFHEISRSMPPLRGVIHAAGVLDDGVLAKQDWSRFERVLKPKVCGAWILHELTASLPLDFFVLFSSMAVALGAPGQGSYAAANAFEDALAQERRRRGLPAISIDWGAWAGGMAAGEGLAQRRQELGMETLSAEAGLALLDCILLDNPVQVGAGYVDWAKFVLRYGERPIPKRFPKVSGALQGKESRKSTESELKEQLSAAPESRRADILRDHLQALALRVLGFAPNRRIDFAQPLTELGLDSLMAVEFRNLLAGSVKRALPSTLLFNYPTLGNLQAHIGALLFENIAADGNAPVTAEITPQSVLNNVEELSDEEVDRLLAQRPEGVQ